MDLENLRRQVHHMDGKRQQKPQIDVEKHPLHFLALVAKKHPEIEAFILLTYDVQDGKYGSTRGDREKHFVPADLIVDEGLRIIEEAAIQGLDTVIASEVRIKGGGVRHMRFIDLSIPGEEWALNQTLGDGIFFPAFSETGANLNDFAFYKSGRSFHAYGTDLMTEEEWHEWNAMLLTLPGVEIEHSVVDDENTGHGTIYNGPVIDFRWIGHQFLRECSALRLSATDMHYVQIPVLAGKLPASLEPISI